MQFDKEICDECHGGIDDEGFECRYCLGFGWIDAQPTSETHNEKDNKKVN